MVSPWGEFLLVSQEMVNVNYSFLIEHSISKLKEDRRTAVWKAVKQNLELDSTNLLLIEKSTLGVLYPLT